jgi:response regulator RpfG family c-di-GMP phosphodiesterase
VLKADPRTAMVPIIFLTALSTPEEKVRGFDLGAVDYITKPFDPTELAARLRGLLERLERGGWHEVRRENTILNVLAPPAVRRDVRKIKAFRQICKSAITIYDGTEEQYVAVSARRSTEPTPKVSDQALAHDEGARADELAELLVRPPAVAGPHVPPVAAVRQAVAPAVVLPPAGKLQ